MQGQPIVHNVSVMSKFKPGKFPRGNNCIATCMESNSFMSLRQKHDYIKQNTTYRIGIRAEKVSKKMFCPKIFLNSDFELSV